jgi:lipoprotein NlpD
LRFSRSICSVGLYCVLLGACADTAVEGPESYVVRPEDTLYSVAWRHDLDFRDLARWNNIGPDFRISVGQIVLLGPPQVSKPRPLALPSASTPNPQITPTPAGIARARESRAMPGAANATHPWVWPTDRDAAPRAVPGGGILFAGRLGQDVRAASAGRVVYTGSGLRGYGNLIIIKHADSLLSAYAHNREMLVHDGQEVAAGQVIAHMGEGAGHAPILYFEIRQNGKPIDPLAFFSR